jgi:hypothetical protein
VGLWFHVWTCLSSIPKTPRDCQSEDDKEGSHKMLDTIIAIALLLGTLGATGDPNKLAGGIPPPPRTANSGNVN